MIGRFSFMPHPAQNLSIALHRRAGGDFAAAERSEGRLVEDVAGAVDGFDPFAPVLGGGEIVEAEGGPSQGIGRFQLHRSPRIRIHRTHMHLVGRDPYWVMCHHNVRPQAKNGTSNWDTQHPHCCE